MPSAWSMKLLASEAAVLRYLRAHSDIPVPEVYDYWYELSQATALVRYSSNTLYVAIILIMTLGFRSFL